MRKLQKTYMPKPGERTPRWHVIDAEGKVLGRLCTDIAKILQGKHLPIVARHAVTGDFVVVVNAAKVAVTGRKLEQKTYYRHSQYHGGLRETTLDKVMAKHPEDAITRAVRGMLPPNRLRPILLRRLKVYAGPEHPHRAQVGISNKLMAATGEQPPATKSTLPEAKG